MTEQSKHTPGTWTANGQFINGPNGVTIAMTFREGGSHCQPEHRISYEEELANAHLIVSAPKLLKALRDMLHHFCGCGEQTQTDAEVMREAREAIAQTEGERHE